MQHVAETSDVESADFRAHDATFDPSRRCCEILEILNEILDGDAEREEEPAVAGA